MKKRPSSRKARRKRTKNRRHPSRSPGKAAEAERKDSAVGTQRKRQGPEGSAFFMPDERPWVAPLQKRIAASRRQCKTKQFLRLVDNHVRPGPLQPLPRMPAPRDGHGLHSRLPRLADIPRRVANVKGVPAVCPVMPHGVKDLLDLAEVEIGPQDVVEVGDRSRTSRA